MKIGMLMSVSQVGYEEYSKVLKEIGIDNEKQETWPTGLILHMAGPRAGIWQIIDIWNSMEEFEIFLNSRLMPVLKKTNSQIPKIEFFDIYNMHIKI